MEPAKVQLAAKPEPAKVNKARKSEVTKPAKKPPKEPGYEAGKGENAKPAQAKLEVRKPQKLVTRKVRNPQC